MDTWSQFEDDRNIEVACHCGSEWVLPFGSEVPCKARMLNTQSPVQQYWETEPWR